MNTSAQTSARDAVMPPQSAATEPKQYLTFLLGTETFAIGILAIKEIIEYGNPTEIPMMPDCVRGVINLRGAVVPVLDLHARFGRSPAAATKRTCNVIVEMGAHRQARVIGVIVDAVNEVIDISDADIEPAPDFGTRIRGEFIRGIGKVRGSFVIVLDVDKILALDELVTLDSIDAPAHRDEPGSELSS